MADSIIALYTCGKDAAIEMGFLPHVLVNMGGTVLDAYQYKFRGVHPEAIAGENTSGIPTLQENRIEAVEKMAPIEEAVRKVFGGDCYARALVRRAMRLAERLVVIVNLTHPEEFHCVRNMCKESGANCGLWVIETESTDPETDPMYRKNKAGSYSRAVRFDREFKVDTLQDERLPGLMVDSLNAFMANIRAELDDAAYDDLSRTHPDMADMPVSYVTKL